jgi:hypothetical protein
MATLEGTETVIKKQTKSERKLQEQLEPREQSQL